MKRERGSAIIIAILLVTAIGTIAFSFGRILILEANNASVYENGVGSYYAAESGIEEGLLRYRYSDFSSVPFDTWKLKDNSSVFRADLAGEIEITGSSIIDFKGINKNTSTISDPSKQYYDLRMGYLGNGIDESPFYGQDINSDENLLIGDILDTSYGVNKPILKIDHDQTLTVRLPSTFVNVSNDLSAFFKYDSAIDSADLTANARVIVEAIDSSGMSSRKNVVFNSDGNPDNFSTVDASIANRSFSLTQILTGLYPLGVPLGSEITLKITPIYYDVQFGLISTKCQNTACDMTNQTVVPGPFTTINSTGYFGGTLRTMQAKIDRKSGTMYDLYKFVIYNAGQ
ncbi:MAG: hypothetical protein NTW50_02145 [Candidatus Berkelbacteria bacterium]|nr:hypothetical protein [Candidatus Berkelbacteria bacterium]